MKSEQLKRFLDRPSSHASDAHLAILTLGSRKSVKSEPANFDLKIVAVQKAFYFLPPSKQSLPNFSFQNNFYFSFNQDRRRML
jgi:hypothetical protein